MDLEADGFFRRRWIIAAWVFAVIILGFNLGSEGMYAPQEGRTAIIVKNMLRSGNYMDMTVEGMVPYEKPVGHYWLCLPTAGLFGLDADPMTVSPEWALRIPSFLSAIIALLAASILAERIYGTRTAAITVVMLASMAKFVHLARVAHIDMPLAAAFACAMLFLYLGYFANWKSNRLIYGFYAFLGWGMVLKGPLVLILAGLVVLGMMIRFRRWRTPLEMRPITGTFLMLMLALPWYVAETVRSGGEFFDEFIVNQNLRRFTGIGSVYSDGEFMPVYYYIPKMFAEALPWSPIAVAALIVCFRRLIRLRFSTGSVFLLMWLVTGFVFFSLSALKRGDYLLPLYPALAILTARAFELGAEKIPKLWKHWRIVLWTAGGLLAALYALSVSGLLIRAGNYCVTHEIRHIAARDAKSLIMFSEFANGLWLWTALGVIIVLLALRQLGRYLEQRRIMAAFVLTATMIMAAYTAFYGWIEPATDVQKSVKPFIPEARKFWPADKPVVYYSEFNTELVYFMDRPYIYVDRRQTPKQEMIMTDDRGERRLMRDMPGCWKTVLSTRPDHQYPVVVMERLAAQSAQPETGKN
ncbi:MAG: glycosyltransferase family 39 protein [Victivallaceae bacterium]|nr:glycosyltransferase family 39 protein [Victivallaceae bacterium]